MRSTLAFYGKRLIELAMAVVLLTVLAQGQVLAQTVIDFEDLPNLTVVTTQYGSRGVFFGSDRISTVLGAHSGTHTLYNNPPDQEISPEPMVIEFTSLQRRVQLYAGGLYASKTPANAILSAYNQMGVLIDQDGPKPVTNKPITLFSVSTASPAIVRIELKIDGEDIEIIDDLEFQGEAPAPVPSEPPVVQITAPVDGTELDAAEILVKGTVAGPSLSRVGRLRIDYGRPPNSQAPPDVVTSEFILAGTGETRAFTFTFGNEIGPFVITVEAENLGGLIGSDTVRFTNLPEQIRNRYAAAGGAETFGELLYSTRPRGCAIAGYRRGAIASVDSTTYVIAGAIYEKWVSLEDQRMFGIPLGCPLGEKQDSSSGANLQDFAEGRIYSDLPTGAHYVPKVFVQAIETLGGESAIGLPIVDPTSADETWLFQQFTRPELPTVLLPTTLEIRGTPPILSVEQDNGDGSLPVSATIWQQFPCDDYLGPCNVSLPSPPLRHMDHGEAGERYCNGRLWPFAPAWRSITERDTGLIMATRFEGVVIEAHIAGTDNPKTHECTDAWYNPIAALDGFDGVDYDIFALPLSPFQNLVFEGQDDLELEFESCFLPREVDIFYVDYPLPRPRDLLFASGIWVVDCGHADYHAEIHPPAVLAWSRYENVNGYPAMSTRIWVNGTYTGRPVNLDIFPRPRPSADAVLHVRKTMDSWSSVGVNLQYKIADDHIELQFSAPVRPVRMADNGQVTYESGRTYLGRWDLYWTTE